MNEVNFEEFKVLAKAMRALWTRDNFLPDGEAVKTWYLLLQDLPAEVATTAVQKYAMTHSFPPTVAGIRKEAATVLGNEKADWGDAWGKVRKAIGRFGRYSEKEGLESLDDMTRSCVERIGWKTLCESEDETADRANFRMLYEIEAERKEEEALLPENLKKRIAGYKQIEGGTI